MITQLPAALRPAELCDVEASFSEALAILSSEKTISERMPVVIALDNVGAVSRIEATPRAPRMGGDEFAGYYQPASETIELANLQHPYCQSARFKMLRLAVQRKSKVA